MRAGYTLVELSIVIIIVGLLTAGGLAVGASMVERAAYIDTSKLIQQLRDSLKDFYIVNGRLPCVAPLTTAPGTSGFGEEIANCSSGVAGPAGTFRQGAPAVRIGMVPVRSLGLPDTAAADKFGNRIIYAVPESLTDTTLFGAGAGAITVRDMTNAVILGDAAFFIVSPGKDHKGAYAYQTGNISTCGTSANLDVLNCTFTNTEFRDAPFNNGVVENRFFDDLTAWAPKFHLSGLSATSDTLWAASGDANLYSVGTDNDTSNTNVGIGTSAPAEKLHVNGNSKIDGSLFMQHSSPTLYLQDSNELSSMIHANGNRLYFLRGPINSTAWDSLRPLTIDLANNRVGVGTANPSEALQVVGNLETTNGFLGVGGHGANYMHLAHANYKAQNQYALLQHGTAGHLYLNSVGTGNIYFRTNNGTQNHITIRGSDGQVGINNNDPQYRLDVNGHARFGNLLINSNTGDILGNRDGVNNVVIVSAGTTSNHRSEIRVSANDDLDTSGSIRIMGRNHSSMPGEIRYLAASNLGQGASAQSTTLHWFRKRGTNLDPTTLMAIQASGRVHIYGDGGNCTLGNNTNNTACSSDARWKKDVEPISDAMGKINAIRGVYYRWNDVAPMQDKESLHLGVIAQEVQKVFPEAVEEMKTENHEHDHLTVGMGALVPPLIEAVKALDKRVKELEAQQASDPADAPIAAAPSAESGLDYYRITIIGLLVIIVALLLSRRK